MGGFALFFGLFFVVLLYDIPLFLYVCGPITVIPGVIAIAVGVRQWRRERTVVEFANWAKSQRRIKMDLMAQRLGKTRFETEKLLGKALNEGLVKGAIDRTTDEFVSQDALKQESTSSARARTAAATSTRGTSRRNASCARTASGSLPSRRTPDFRGTRPLNST